jgi:hypothetical protein
MPKAPPPEAVERKPTAPAAVAVETSETKIISDQPDTLAALKSAGWITTDLFEFSPTYRRS